MNKRFTTALLATVSIAAMSHGTMAQVGSGFLISIDGKAVSGDPRLDRVRKKADVALARAKVQVQFDGLEVQPRLTAVLVGNRTPRSGEVATVESQMNYPAYVERGELRVLDMSARGGPRVVEKVAIAPNGRARLTVPEGDNLVIVHRVYDAKGRYDETAPLVLRADRDNGFETDLTRPPEEGVDGVIRRRIPVYGGAVTVSGSDVRPGAVVETLGETVRPDSGGNFVIQRILPAGDQAVAVAVKGRGENTYIERDINIPRADWFYTATVDLTYGRRLEGGLEGAGTSEYDKTYSFGRIAGYAKGRTQSGWLLTGSVDTGEDDLDRIFRDLDKKDPYNVLLRLQRENAYPTYGDDSTFVEGAPTDGKFYLRAEKNGSHVMWGNYRSSVAGGYYLQNERTLYGFQGVYRSPATTSRGQSKVSAEVYAASPDNLPGRDSFLGTGGSVYFLQRQDIQVGTDTVSVEVRDRDTGRLIETRQLVEGRDYRINYVQGVIYLAEPLSGSGATGTVVTNPGGDYDVRLVAQYEFTPVAGDVDGYSYGGRVEGWLGDNVRLGYTGMVEQTDVADQTAQAVDLRLEYSEQTFLDLEYAETRGPGFGSSFSSDGGLIITNTATAGTEDGTGEAMLVRGQASLTDLGLNAQGEIAAYFEKRTEGFSTLNYQTSVDEELWGLSLRVEASEQLSYRFYYDDFEDAAGRTKREGGAELRYDISDRLALDLGVEHLDRNTPAGLETENGSRTDVAARVTMTPSEVLQWYLFGQATLNRSGGLEKNDRVGVGLKYRFAQKWTAELEVSDGTLGLAGQAMMTYQSDETDSLYFGYRLDPGRDFAGVDLQGKDKGQYVSGGKRRLSEDVDIYGENTYDLFGNHRSLSSAYGVEYRASDVLTLFGDFEFGQIDDPRGDFDRKALSLGMRYENERGLTGRARLELRRDRGETNNLNRDSDASLLTAALRYEIDDSQRLLFNLDYADTDTDDSSLLSGEYVDVSLGYAYRPVLDDRLNVLFKYRYLEDTIGQDIDGSTARGPRQVSHILSVDADYDLNQNWSVGGKLGARLGRSSPDDTIALADNDAYLAVFNARYHLTHKWDLLIEGRHLEAGDAGISETSILGAAYRHVGNNLKVGVGYNTGSFSDDLSDLTYDEEGVFVNFIAKF